VSGLQDFPPHLKGSVTRCKATICATVSHFSVSQMSVSLRSQENVTRCLTFNTFNDRPTYLLIRTELSDGRSRAEHQSFSHRGPVVSDHQTLAGGRRGGRCQSFDARRRSFFKPTATQNGDRTFASPDICPSPANHHADICPWLRLG